MASTEERVWRTEDLRQDTQATQQTDAVDPMVQRIMQRDFEAARERDLDERLARLSKRFGVEPPTPRSWSWADRLRGGKPETRSRWQQTKERK